MCGITADFRLRGAGREAKHGRPSLHFLGNVLLVGPCSAGYTCDVVSARSSSSDSPSPHCVAAVTRPSHTRAGPFGAMSQ
jgi:hypothetical protein